MNEKSSCAGYCLGSVKRLLSRLRHGFYDTVAFIIGTGFQSHFKESLKGCRVVIAMTRICSIAIEDPPPQRLPCFVAVAFEILRWMVMESS